MSRRYMCPQLFQLINITRSTKLGHNNNINFTTFILVKDSNLTVKLQKYKKYNSVDRALATVSWCS